MPDSKPSPAFSLGASINADSLVLREVLLAPSLGTVIGVILALVGNGGAATLLYDLQPNDPLTFCAAIALLICVTLLGSLLPARRAASVDPMIVLRYE